MNHANASAVSPAARRRLPCPQHLRRHISAQCSSEEPSATATRSRKCTKMRCPAPTTNTAKTDPRILIPPANGGANGCWYGEFEFVVWHRTPPHDGRLGIDTSGFLPGQRQNLNRHGTSLGLEPGAEGTLGYILDRDIDNRDHSIEFTYLGFNNWRADDGLRAKHREVCGRPLHRNIGGFNFSDTMGTVYQSSLQTMEVGYRVRNRPGRDRMIMGPDGFWSRELTPGARNRSLWACPACS